MKIKKYAALTLSAVVLTFALSPAALAAEDGRELIPMGCTVGIQINMGGIIVVGLTTVGEKNEESPAGRAGIMPGDLIVRLGANEVTKSDEFLKAMTQLDGSDVSVTILRGDKKIQYTVTPVKGDDGAYKLGLWLRDGVAGIGTVTFVDPETGAYGALGHGINDMDSGAIIPVGDGNILDASIVSVKKGEVGSPGEICGCYDSENHRGKILINSECGIFGIMDEGSIDSSKTALPAAEEAEINLGKATILANVSGEEICEYEIEVTRVYRNAESGKSMMISVTDPRLIEETGGIVQGMSGSPIIQNGKIIGAVTHVLVNDPTRGYGISIQDMLEVSDETTALDKAS